MPSPTPCATLQPSVPEEHRESHHCINPRRAAPAGGFQLPRAQSRNESSASPCCCCCRLICPAGFIKAPVPALELSWGCTRWEMPKRSDSPQLCPRKQPALSQAIISRDLTKNPDNRGQRGTISETPGELDHSTGLCSGASQLGLLAQIPSVKHTRRVTATQSHTLSCSQAPAAQHSSTHSGTFCPSLGTPCDRQGAFTALLNQHPTPGGRFYFIFIGQGL